MSNETKEKKYWLLDNLHFTIVYSLDKALEFLEIDGHTIGHSKAVWYTKYYTDLEVDK